jgi:hypothetical protein
LMIYPFPRRAKSSPTIICASGNNNRHSTFMSSTFFSLHDGIIIDSLLILFDCYRAMSALLKPVCL